MIVRSDDAEVSLKSLLHQLRTKSSDVRLGAVAHACNRSTVEAEAVGSPVIPEQEFETSLVNVVKPCLY